jgi:hypothetical protein
MANLYPYKYLKMNCIALHDKADKVFLYSAGAFLTYKVVQNLHWHFRARKNRHLGEKVLAERNAKWTGDT